MLSLYSFNCLKNVFNKGSHIFKLIIILRHSSTAKVQIAERSGKLYVQLLN